MEVDLIQLCRTCGKKNFIFCDVHHELIQKLLRFIPSLLDASLSELPLDICVTCYQMIKTLVFNIEGIADMQKILEIQSRGKKTVTELSQELPAERKRSLVEDITKKYTNIKLRKITSPEKPTTKPAQKNTNLLSPETRKVVIVEEAADRSPREPDRNELKRSFMCISCSEKFQKFSDLEIHLRTCKTTPTQQFKCFCGSTLGSKKALSDHVSFKHKQNKQQHICSICKNVFSTLSNLQNHMKVHKSTNGKFKGIYMCHVCSSKHADLDALKAHRVVCKKKSSEL